MSTLKELYNLQPDEFGLNTGLISWYNNVINKAYDELDVVDVSKMYCQGWDRMSRKSEYKWVKEDGMMILYKRH